MEIQHCSQCPARPKWRFPAAATSTTAVCVALPFCERLTARSTRIHRRSSSVRSCGAGTRRSSNRRAPRRTKTERSGVPIPYGWSSTTPTLPTQRGGYYARLNTLGYSGRLTKAVQRTTTPRTVRACQLSKPTTRSPPSSLPGPTFARRQMAWTVILKSLLVLPHGRRLDGPAGAASA